MQFHKPVVFVVLSFTVLVPLKPALDYKPPILGSKIEEFPFLEPVCCKKHQKKFLTSYWFEK
jgi:hypothetical protein